MKAPAVAYAAIVYGGLPLAFAGALGAAARSGDGEGHGVVRAVAIASAGMAAGRLAGAAVERELPAWPTGAFLALESALAGSLLAALRQRRRRLRLGSARDAADRPHPGSWVPDARPWSRSGWRRPGRTRVVARAHDQ